MNTTEFEAALQQYTKRINDYLRDWMTAYTTPSLAEQEINPRLLEAVQYSIHNGGKRLRPCLIYAVGAALGASQERLDAPAAAVELIHCYSLIHDDLPAMDNDEWRRGKLTCHKAFDEATAILAGDGLHTLAFELLANPTHNPVADTMKIKMIQTLARAAGLQGMVGGQALDMSALSQTTTLNSLRQIHQKKTGALIAASVQLAAIAAQCSDETILLALKNYAERIGLAYQVQDDLLDSLGTIAELGKNPGQDEALNKATFPALLGLPAAKAYAHQLYQEALQALALIVDLTAHPTLKQLSEFLVYRTY